MFELEAFGKSQKPDGTYARAVDLNEHERYALHADIKDGVHYADFKGSKAPAGRCIKSVYAAYADGPGVKDALEEHLRPSQKHAKVHYGSSVSPEMEARIDEHLDPAQLRRLKSPVAFHHGKNGTGVLAGANRAHVTTKHIHRVILSNELINRSGHYAHPALHGLGHFKEVLNHEVGHVAGVGRKTNPYATFADHNGNLKQRRAIGDEARADATGVPGKGIYERNGAIYPRSDWTKGSIHDHYHDIHEAVAHRQGPKWQAPPSEHVPVKTTFDRMKELEEAGRLARHHPTPGELKYAAGVRINPKAAAVVGGVAAGAGVGLLIRHWRESEHPRNHGKFSQKGTTVSKNDITSADEVFSKLKRDHWGGAKKGAKIGALTGGIVGGTSGAVTGAVGGIGAASGFKHTLAESAKMPGAAKAAVLGAGTLGAASGLSGALHGGVVGGAIGGSIGRKKVQKSYSADVEECFAKARESQVEKGFGSLAEVGEHLGAVKNAVTNPVNHAAIKGVASFHAGNIAHAVNGMSTGAKVGSAAGASFLAGAAAMHHHLSN